MKKIIMILVSIICCLFITNVKADSKFIEGDWVPGIYVNKHIGGKIYFSQFRMINEINTGVPVYCAQAGVGFLSNTLYSSAVTNAPSILGVKAEQWEKASAIAYYGFRYGTHMEPKWYAISQMMIWWTLSPQYDIYFTDSLNGNKVTRYQNEIDEINELISAYNKKPDFASTSVETGIGSTVSFVDRNNALSDYKVVSNNKINYTMNGNELKITPLVTGDITVYLEKSETRFSNSATLFHHDTGQDILMRGNLNPIRIELKLKVKAGRVTIYKKDQDTWTNTPSGEGKLAGAMYGLYNNGNVLIDTITIGSNLEGSTSKELPFGNYYIQEITPGQGYTLDPTKYPVTINNANSLIFLHLYNTIIKRNITVFKYYEDYDTKEQYLEENAVFEIYNYKDELVSTVTTNEYGEFEIELPFGTYKFVQIEGIKNYYFAESFYITVDEDLEEDFVINLINYEIIKSLKIVKTDEDNKPIPDIEFRIKNLDKDVYLKETYTTDENGEINILIGIGNYIIEELNAPSGFIKMNPTEFSINEEDEDFFLKLINYKVPEIEPELEPEISIQYSLPNTDESYNFNWYLLILVIILKKQF